jgi:iron-sulfur cluster repair protein YtfE (RIC family)
MKFESFSELATEHAHLDRLFRKHQRSLIESEIDNAVSILKSFATELDRHIDFEEQRLFTLYADKGGETAGGTLELFQAEHRKLRESLEHLIRQVETLGASTDRIGSILSLLDEENIFKGLFHHHAFREQNLLFPRLDELSTEEERKIWLNRG